MKQCPLQTAARVETRREVISAECAAHRSARTLQKYCSDKKDREAYLYVGQCRLEQNHCQKGTTPLWKKQAPSAKYQTRLQVSEIVRGDPELIGSPRFLPRPS